MKSASLIAAIAVVVGVSSPLDANNRQPAVQTRRVKARPARPQILVKPQLESALPRTAVIQWTANTAGGTTRHYGIVRYGTARQHLVRTARSPVRWCKTCGPEVTYRVRLDGLEPSTTYYYAVDAAHANDVSLGLRSPIGSFTTPPRR